VLFWGSHCVEREPEVGWIKYLRFDGIFKEIKGIKIYIGGV
jgi:hypothetical protein